ncbi:unnamed protein product [Ceratitis capitata]|uniref:(Mediterranean fruit fly) hypothetical protein n=1 Tax=Ceratitis capitata TaxID=7213 RepID=A0A811UN11_CERCA|nr:unnamed protein product [Ceratitis capitata]
MPLRSCRHSALNVQVDNQKYFMGIKAATGSDFSYRLQKRYAATQPTLHELWAPATAAKAATAANDKIGRQTQICAANLMCRHVYRANEVDNTRISALKSRYAVAAAADVADKRNQSDQKDVVGLFDCCWE